MTGTSRTPGGACVECNMAAGHGHYGWCSHAPAESLSRQAQNATMQANTRANEEAKEAEQLTLRDRFAMAALTGLMGTKEGQEVVFEAAELYGMEPIDVAAVTAYAQADAMLSARKAPKEK